MTKYWILLGTAFFSLTSCGDTSSVQDTEKSLLTDTSKKETVIEEVVKESTPIFVVCLREGSLLEKPAQWSKTNSSVKNGKFYDGSTAKILDTNDEGKRRYLKLQLNDGTEGWVSDWLIAEDALRAVVTTKNIRLYKKADIAAFSDKKIVFAQKVAVGNELVGGFKKIVYKGEDKKPHTYWVKEKDLQHISVEDTDYVLAEYYAKLQAIEDADQKAELVEDIRGNEEYINSPFYSSIIGEELDTENEEVLSDTLPNEILIDTVEIEDEF